MKSTFTLFLVALSWICSAQFQINFIGDSTFLRGEQGDDFDYHYEIINLSNTDTLELGWRLWHDLSTSENAFGDYFYEPIFIAWPETYRSHKMEILPGDTHLASHRIWTHDWQIDTCGTWVAHLSFFLGDDSSNTDYKYEHIAQTGTFTSNGQDSLFVCDDDTMLIVDGAYWPLNNHSNFSESDRTSLCVFPNPATSLATIHYRLQSNQGHLEVRTLHGQLVLEKPLKNTETQAEIASLPASGLYLIRLIDGTELKHQEKLIFLK